VVSKAVVAISPLLSRKGTVAVAVGQPFPALFLATDKSPKRFWEFFTANIRKAYTRKAYLKAAIRFSDWCQALKRERDQVQPVHVAVSIEHLGGERATPIGAAKRRFVRCDYGRRQCGGVWAANSSSRCPDRPDELCSHVSRYACAAAVTRAPTWPRGGPGRRAIRRGG